MATLSNQLLPNVSTPDTTAADSDGADRGPKAIAIFWVQAVIATTVIAARWYARITKKQVGADDYWMLLTWMLFIASACVVTYQATLAGYKHMSSIEPQHLEQVGINVYILQTLGVIAFATGKLAVGCTILRFCPPKFWQRWVVLIPVGYTFVQNCVVMVLAFLQCIPSAALWNPQIPHMCWDPRVQIIISYVGTAENILVDFILALLPLSIIPKLNVSLGKRVSLCILLGLSLMAGICGIVKITYIGALGARADVTWITYELVMWSISEIFVMIVCGSVPALKPLYTRYVSSRRNRGLQGYSYTEEKGVPWDTRPHKSRIPGSPSDEESGVGPPHLWSSGNENFIVCTTNFEVSSTSAERK